MSWCVPVLIPVNIPRENRPLERISSFLLEHAWKSFLSSTLSSLWAKGCLHRVGISCTPFPVYLFTIVWRYAPRHWVTAGETNHGEQLTSLPHKKFSDAPFNVGNVPRFGSLQLQSEIPLLSATIVSQRGSSPDRPAITLRQQPQ